MNILFYVEPLIERGSPTAKRAWLIFVSKMATAIKREVPESKFLFVISDALADEPIAFKRDGVVLFRQSELVPSFGSSTLAVASHWYSGGQPSTLEGMANLLLQRVGNFIPTVCITFSPAPFLKTAFPTSPVLHFEHGFVSRPPFPMTGFLDPMGMVMSGFPADQYEAIEQYVPTLEEENLVNHIKKSYTDFFDATNPLSNKIRAIRDRFTKLVLVSLQVPGFYAFDSHAQFPDQIDLVIQVLEQVPNEVGVIVSEHPQCSVLGRDALAYLTKRYPNLVWLPELREMNSPSFFLMQHIDVVITVSSTVGLQSLLWEKKLVVAGGGNLAKLADSCILSELPAILGRSFDQKKNKILAWHITRYAMPFDLMFDGDLLLKRIKKSILNENASPSKDYFNEPFSQLENIRIAYDRSLLNAQIAALSNFNEHIVSLEDASKDTSIWIGKLNEILHDKHSNA